ncbi:hypothetical protein WJX73_003948 [Symbiochloris irregularis]|uniref:PROP1-like PPR domain-containing protein n=1 Tax=Symbiochloris irregularis TaxID=706552 RepID=A0AAW1PBI4_9CHLO
MQPGGFPEASLGQHGDQFGLQGRTHSDAVFALPQLGPGAGPPLGGAFARDNAMRSARSLDLGPLRGPPGHRQAANNALQQTGPGGFQPGSTPPQQRSRSHLQAGNRSASAQLGGSAGRGGGGLDPERGQGYRKLWQQVTKVGRGQKLGESNGALEFADMTVEDLLHIIRNLPPEESAVQAVSRGLFYLDSRALAALLKELHKAGLSNRASELFDWLRALPEGHELGPLCDVYTYTTLISQCGSHQQLRKALELVAEMRGRGIACNVHTYSALMNVCIKANELELALDVYNQLVRDGCTPNLVTYNILIDVHGKTGQWHEAIKVLDALESQGTKPEVRTYNTIINACNRSGQPEYALQVYERMLAEGTHPTATTYTALISAYGKTGKVEAALQIFEDMVARGCERNVITYSSLISACEKAGQWRLALQLFDEMHRDGCKPNVVTHNALIAACGQAGQWKAAREVFEGMGNSGCKPDAVTFSTLIAAYDKGGQWPLALQALDDMSAQGHRPDVGVVNVLVDMLSRSGVLLAQAKAVRLFQAAARQGQLRMMPQGPVDVTVVAFTVGTAVLATLQWLHDLRTRLAKNGWSRPPGQERVGLLLLKGKQGRSEAPSPAIQTAVQAVLDAAQIPFAVSIVSQGVRVEVDTNASAGLSGPALEGLLAPLDAGSFQEASRKLPNSLVITEDAGSALRCAKAFAAVKEFEDNHQRSPQKQQGSGASLEELLGDPAGRRERTLTLLHLARGLALSDEAAHDACQLLDRLAHRGLSSADARSPAVLAAALLIAAEQGERQAGVLLEPAAREANVDVQTLTAMQERLRGALGGDAGAISAIRIMHLYLERLGVDFKDTSHRSVPEAQGFMVEALMRPELQSVAPSVLAAAVLAAARHVTGSWPPWPDALISLTGYASAPGTPLAGALAAVLELAVGTLPERPPRLSPTLPIPTSPFRAMSPAASLQDQLQLPFVGMPRPPLIPTPDRAHMLRAGSAGQIPFPLAGGGLSAPGPSMLHDGRPRMQTHMQRATSMVTGTSDWNKLKSFGHPWAAHVNHWSELCLLGISLGRGSSIIVWQSVPHASRRQCLVEDVI